MTNVTKENQVGKNYFYHISKTNTTGRMCVRRTGKTKTWKSRPSHFRIPCKYGLYEHGYITNWNCGEWTID